MKDFSEMLEGFMFLREKTQEMKVNVEAGYLMTHEEQLGLINTYALALDTQVFMALRMLDLMENKEKSG